MSATYNRYVPSVVIKSNKKKTDPLLDLLSVPCDTISAGKELGGTTTPATETTRLLAVRGSHADVEYKDSERSGHPISGMGSHGRLEVPGKPGLLDESTGIVRPRRRLLKRKEEQGVDRVEKEVGNDNMNLATLAAQAGAHAAHGCSPLEKNQRDVHTRERSSEAPLRTKRKKKAKPKSNSLSKISTADSKTQRGYRKKADLSCIVVNGTAIPRVVGVPDHVITEMASVAASDRPVRCGVCRSCENPARKKACEVIRALGANPPIPRGKNRLAILGPENMKIHVSRTCEGPLNVSPSAGNGMVRRPQTKPDADNETGVVEDNNGWTDEQLRCLYQVILEISPNTNNFWQKVAASVPNRNEAECFAKIHESVPYYSSKSKPRKSSTSSKKSKPLDPNSKDYVSNIMERRRERALGHLASSAYASLQRSNRKSTLSPSEDDAMVDGSTLNDELLNTNDIQTLLLEQRNDEDGKNPSHEQSSSIDTWSEEF